jgi:hypothetical protein
MTFSSLPFSTISASTVAPFTVGAPTCVFLVVAQHSTWSNTIFFGLPSALRFFRR